MSTDENLLFGVLAMQADFIDAARFAEACSAWAMRKESALADLLVERGWLSAEERADVDKLLRRKLDKHKGDARAGLAEATNDEVRHSLASVVDDEVRRSLAELPGADSSDPWATTPHEVQRRGRYSLTHLHAQGGIGQVWLARDEQLGREVALKELRAERQDHTAARARFLEEARVTGQLEHPGIVPVYEMVRGGDGSAFYTMRMIRGRTLGDAIREYHKKRQEKKAGPLELRALLTAFVAVCKAVAYAHSRGVLHRDLKPANVVLGDYGEVMVLDWGLAKVVGQKEDDATQVLPVSLEGGRDETMQGQVLGTPVYMAPEQAEGRVDLLGPSTDVYGLGAILYQILTSKPPFDDGTTPEVLQRVIREEPERPRQRVPATPRGLEAVCLKAMAKKPGERYASASEMAKDVEHWLADEPVSAWREPVRVRVGRWMRRHQSLVAAMTASVLVFALLGGGLGVWWSGERRRQHDAVETALERVETLTNQGKLEEAQSILEQARSRLGGFGSADLQARQKQVQNDLELVKKFEDIRAERALTVTNWMHRKKVDHNYAKEFENWGLIEGEDVSEAAKRVKDSRVRESLLAALDGWALDAHSAEARAWILAVARKADPIPVRDRFRDPALWQDKKQLTRALADVDGGDLPPNLVVALSAQLDAREAEKLLRQAHQARPDDYWLTQRLGMELFLQQKFQEADGYFLACISLRPKADLPWHLRGTGLMMQKKFVEAVNAHRKAVELAPNNAFAHLNLGIALTQQNNWADAEKVYRKAVELSPNYFFAQLLLGETLTRQNKQTEAEKVYRKAAELALDNASASLGAQLMAHRRFADAEKTYLKSLELDPESAFARKGLASALKAQAKWPDAEKVYHKIAQLNRDNADAQIDLGAVLEKLEKWPEAEKTYREAVRLAPKSPKAYSGLGLALAEQQKWVDAESAYHKLVDISPSDADAHKNLGLTLMRQSKWGAAEKAFRKATAIAPQFAFAHANLGWALEEQQKWAEAEKAFHTATLIAPTDADYHKSLGLTQEKQGKWAEAEKAYSTAVQRGDRTPHVISQLPLLPRMQELHPKLPAYLVDRLRPADNADRLSLALLCLYERLHAASARFYADAFAADPKLGEDLQVGHRYDAAFNSILAASGQGSSAPADPKEKTRLRNQALAWLKADLALHRKKLAIGKDADKSDVADAMRHWQEDTDFDSVRGDNALAALPEDERKPWADLWADVAALLMKADKK